MNKLEDMALKESRYRELLPGAYQTAALLSHGRPESVTVGLVVRDLIDLTDRKSVAYRIAMATRFIVEIVNVVKTPVTINDLDTYKYVISFRTRNNPEVQTIPSPLLNNTDLGRLASSVWDKFDNQGKSQLIGKHMMIYKHNDPPREGDLSKAGYRCCVYATLLD